MQTRNSIFAAILMTLLVVTSALAEDKTEMSELKRLQEWLNVLNQELKAELDQILVLQQAQRTNSQMPLELQNYASNLPLVTEVEAARRRAAEQDAELQARLASLLERTRGIDARKLPILERIYELGSSLSAPPAATAPADEQAAAVQDR